MFLIQAQNSLSCPQGKSGSVLLFVTGAGPVSSLELNRRFSKSIRCVWLLPTSPDYWRFKKSSVDEISSRVCSNKHLWNSQRTFFCKLSSLKKPNRSRSLKLNLSFQCWELKYCSTETLRVKLIYKQFRHWLYWYFPMKKKDRVMQKKINPKSITTGKLDLDFLFSTVWTEILLVYLCVTLFSIRNQKVMKHTAFLLLCVEKNNCIVTDFIASIF